MSEFKIGDRVLYRHFKPEGEPAVVVQAEDEWEANLMPGEILIKLANGDHYYARCDELEIAPLMSARIETKVTKVIVTIHGEDHELTESEAYALFRALDRVL